jgi:hypothetical protein
MTPAAAAVLAATSAFAQAQQPYNANEVIDLYNQQNNFDDAARRTYGPSTQSITVPNNVDLNGIRRGLDSAAADARALSDSLNGQIRYVPAVRGYLADVVRLQALAQSISRSVSTKADLERALPDLRQLDTDWRQVSYQLAQLRGLDRTATDLIKRLDATGDQLTKMLQIGPGVDYRSLVQATASLSTAIGRLTQDIDWELNRTEQGRQLVLESQRIQQQAAHLSDSAFLQETYDHLKQDYNLFQQYWTPFVSKLRSVNNRIIDRDVQQISQAERDVSAQLRMEQTLDRQQLLYMADNLTRNVDNFFENAPVKMVMRLPEADHALASADAFYGMFENFIDCVNRGEAQGDLQDAFGYVDSEWNNFARVYRPLQSTDAQQVLNAIDKDIASLRDALLIQSGFDRRKASELAALVDNLATYIDRDTRSWLAKTRPPYAAEAQRDVSNFRAGARELHEALVANANTREVRQMCDSLFDNWRRVYNHNIKCQSSERPSLASTSSQTTPALVELRTLLGH